MPCSGSSGGLSWMRPRGWRLGLAASPPAEMFYKGGQKGGSGVSAERGTAQRREGGIREKTGAWRNSLPVSLPTRAFCSQSILPDLTQPRAANSPPRRRAAWTGRWPQAHREEPATRSRSVPPAPSLPQVALGKALGGSLSPFPLCEGFLCSN